MKRFLLHILAVGFFVTQYISAQEIKRDEFKLNKDSIDSVNGLNAVNSIPAKVIRQKNPSLPRASEWRAMDLQQKRNVVNKMTSDERAEFLHNMKERIMIDDLEIDELKKEDFKVLYSEYQNNQKKIKERFCLDRDIENLSTTDAANYLNQSFEVAQQLLNNKNSYAKKFLQFLSPQQVLMLFRTEGKIREKVLDKKNDN